MLPFKPALHLKEERVAVRERRSCSRLTLNTGSVPLPSATEGRSDPCWLQRALAIRLSPPQSLSNLPRRLWLIWTAAPLSPHLSPSVFYV